MHRWCQQLNFTCVCDDDYTGEHCEVEINECERLNITCSEHGQCMNEASSYRCVCDPNFTGEICSDVILDESQAPDKTLDMQAMLGGTIGILVFLFLLILVALTMVIVIRKRKRKGR